MADDLLPISDEQAEAIQEGAKLAGVLRDSQSSRKLTSLGVEFLEAFRD